MAKTKSVTVPGGGTVVVPEDVEPTISRRDDGADVVEVPGGSRIVFQRSGAPGRRHKAAPVAVAGMDRKQAEAILTAVVGAVGPILKRLADRVALLEKQLEARGS